MKIVKKIQDILKYNYKELLKICEKEEITLPLSDSVGDVVLAMLYSYIESDYDVVAQGILEKYDKYGIIRSLSDNFRMQPYDVYVGAKDIEKFRLRHGDEITCTLQKPYGNNKLLSCRKVLLVMNKEKVKYRDFFYKKTPIYPKEQIKFERKDNNLIGRMVDIIAPMGYGQRSMILAPPKAGKTTIIRDLAKSVEEQDAHLIMLLIGERPEEVTDTKRSLNNAEVLYSTFDEPASQHVRVAELAISRAQRLSEMGKDVVIILDSISRLARAYNFTAPSSGKVLSGGVEAACLYLIKKLFGSARNLEGSGSLTIIATCLIDTGSRMDDVIHEELKGTGNSEIYLDRDLARSGKYPAINFSKSSTRRPETFLSSYLVNYMNMFRRTVAKSTSQQIHDKLTKIIGDRSTNDDLFVTGRSSRKFMPKN